MASIEPTPDEAQDLRRCVRDLVALSTLPAIWDNAEPASIGRSLAEVLLRLLSADFIYVRLDGRASGTRGEALRTRQRMESPGRAHEIGQVGLASLKRHRVDYFVPVQRKSQRRMKALRNSAKGGRMLACTDVLIVDDNRDAADSLAMLLRIFGYDVRIAYDAGTALDMARERPCHAVFIDLGMPGTDGYQLLPMLRGVTGMAEARLICLTGYGDEEHRLRAVGHGCDGYLIKPAEPDDLLAALSTACSTAIGA